MSEAKSEQNDSKRDAGEKKGGTDDNEGSSSSVLAHVARHFEVKRQWAIEAEPAETTAFDGIELIYSEFVAENADEFEGAAAAARDGSGFGHDLKELHDEYMRLFERDARECLEASNFTLDDFERAVTAHAAAPSAADGASDWFLDAVAGLQNFERFVAEMAAASARQRALMARRRAFRALKMHK